MLKSRFIGRSFASITAVVIAFTFAGTALQAQDSVSVSGQSQIFYPTDELIEDRMSCIQKDVKLTYNAKIKGFIDYFTVKNRNYLAVMEHRKNVYFPIFEEYLRKHNMPDELKYLSIVESGLNPNAISHAGAAGLWQFMPSTGKMYKLHQDFYIDERMDPYEATEAACKYLKELYNMFNDWELALASYNCGPGNVRRAIRKSGYKEDFWGVYNHLPAETRGYVPQFVAITYVMNFLDDYKIGIDTLDYPMAFETVKITEDIDLNRLCKELDVCKEDLKKLNPALKREILPGYLKYDLRIPSDKMTVWTQKSVAIIDSCRVLETEKVAYEEAKKPSRQYYVVRRGDYLGKIADKYNVSINDIKSWNNLRGTTIHYGQKLVIYSKGSPSYNNRAVVTSSSSKSTSQSSQSKGSSKSYYTVKSGDALGRIASLHNVSVSDLKKWNNLNSTVIQVGQKLVIYSDKPSLKDFQDTPKFYMVQPGDTLWSISKKYKNLSVEDIKKKNKLKDENIKPGMKLLIG